MSVKSTLKKNVLFNPRSFLYSDLVIVAVCITAIYYLKNIDVHIAQDRLNYAVIAIPNLSRSSNATQCSRYASLFIEIRCD